jgi:uncharacterized protein YegJ (DUF2314 family)
MWMWIVIGAVAVVLAGVLVVHARRRARRDALVSVVLLLRKARVLTEVDVRGAARRAYRCDVTVKAMPPQDESARAFVVTGDNLPAILVISASRAYMSPEEAETSAQRHEHPVARAAIREHSAWLSVDAVGAGTLRGRELAAAHALLARLAAEFYDEECMLLYLPARERIAAPGADVERKLREGRLDELFGDDALHTPIYHMEQHDEEIEKAIGEAQRRLPEFIEACRGRTDDKPALFKARFDAGGGSEYLWMSVVSVGDGEIEGRVENTPVAEGIPPKGATARVAFDRVVDWAYLDEEGKGHGMFIERILAKRMRKGRR